MLKGLGKWKILNSREKKELVKAVNGQWAASFSFDGGVFEGRDGDIFLISRDIEKLDLENLNVESLGLYFGQVRNGELRLSIEGSQIVGRSAAKNIIEISDEEFSQWIAGHDLEKDYGGCSGYVLIRHEGDFIACGKCTRRQEPPVPEGKDGKILNFVPKARRIAKIQ